MAVCNGSNAESEFYTRYQLELAFLFAHFQSEKFEGWTRNGADVARLAV